MTVLETVGEEAERLRKPGDALRVYGSAMLALAMLFILFSMACSGALSG